MKLKETIGHDKTETLVEIFEGKITHIVNEYSGANFWYFIIDDSETSILLEEVKDSVDSHEIRKEETQ